MHPRLVAELNSHHIAEIARQAARARRSQGLVSQPPRSLLRQRAGWALAGLGLRLATGTPRG
jgi:hypothetical protein